MTWRGRFYCRHPVFGPPVQRLILCLKTWRERWMEEQRGRVIGQREGVRKRRREEGDEVMLLV